MDSVNEYNIGINTASIAFKKRKIFFSHIIENLTKNNMKIIVIDKTNFEEIYKKNIYFQLIITFSYYNKNNIKDIWYYRYAIEKFNYKNILFIESPMFQSIPGFRFSLNSIFHYKNEMPIIRKHIDKKKILIKKFELGDNILFLLQNPLQYFFDFTNHKEYEDYINKIIEEMRIYTNKKIIIRYKPHTAHKINIIDPINNYEISNRTLDADCLLCYKCICHSTNAVTTCAYYGLDIISLSEFNLLHDKAEKNFSKINEYLNVDYTDFFNNGFNTIYSIKDLKTDSLIKLINKII